jgi:hypothetical protein
MTRRSDIMTRAWIYGVVIGHIAPELALLNS